MLMLKMLGTIDIIAGILLIFPNLLYPLSVVFGIVVLIKGIYSYSFTIANGSFFDMMGTIDLLAGISMILNLSIPFLWIFLFLKGTYSLF
jgi:hypothetical protein